MPLLKIAEIKVNDRQREDYGDLADLANSLADPRYGQLQPIIVDRSNTLVAGGRRLAAAAFLGQQGKSIHGLGVGEIEAIYRDVLSPEHAELMEAEENIRRKQLEWKEEQKAIAKIHTRRMESDKDWSADKTAALIGVSRRAVYNALELSKAVDEHPDVAGAETPSGAMMRLNRIKDLKKREDDVKVATLAKQLGMKPSLEARIIHGDAVDRMVDIPDESVDGVVFNPPFGVEIEQLFTSERKIYSGDDPFSMTYLVDKVVEQSYRILKPNRWMVMFYPTARLEDVKGIGPAMWESIRSVIGEFAQSADILMRLENICAGMLARNGFSFSQVPAVWVKPNKRVSALGDPYAQLNIAHETFYFARKGKAILREIPHSNIFTFDTPGVNRSHPLEMPVDLWRTILRAIAVTGEAIVEPFAGTGSAGEAAIDCGMNYLGIELDAEFALRGNVRLTGKLNGTLKPTEEPIEQSTIVANFGALASSNLFND